MKRLVICILAVLCAGCKPKITAKAPSVRYHGYLLNHKAIEYAKGFTVLISHEGFGGGGRGSGVLVGPGYVLTCWHVARGTNDATLVYTYPIKRVYHAKLVYGDPLRDLAILQLDGLSPRHGKVVINAEHFSGQPITIMGNIMGSMQWFVSYGIISGENAEFLYTDGLVLGGDSGGPWINDNGEIVALTDWLLEGNGKRTGIGGGIRADVIGQFLTEWMDSMGMKAR